MKYYLVLEVKEPSFLGLPAGEKRVRVRPVESLGIEEYGWFHPSRIIHAESMTETHYPPTEKHFVFWGVRQAVPEKSDMQAWIEEEPKATEGRFWTAGPAKFNLQNYETARLAWFAKMPGRED